MRRIFKDVNCFMVRTPSLPIKTFIENIESPEDFEDLHLKNFECYREQFEEAMCIGSYDLYNAMNQYIKENKNGDKNDLLNSIFKYFSRNCTRCTPFGLFSTVAFGKISSKPTSLVLKDSDVKRRPLIDLEWLFKVVFLYESKYIESLCYTVNESVTIYRKKAILLSAIQENNGEKIDKKTVNYSNAFDIVMKAAEAYISYTEIVSTLKKAYPDVDEDIFHNYIHTLIKEGYLISDLRPPLTVKNQFEYFIHMLEKHNIDTDDLVSIYENIKKYAIEEYGNKTECLLDVYSQMKAVQNAKNYLTIDSTFEYKECNLNEKTIDKINGLVDLFIRFNIQDSVDRLSDYKNKFIEKYGLSRCVPLIELIDSDTGLGYPEHYNGIRKSNNWGEYVNPWVKFFEKKYIEAIRLKTHIEIVDAEINNLDSGEMDATQFPKSMEIYFNYALLDGQEIFYLSNIFGSTYAGKSFGRFSHLMEKAEDFYENINSLCSRNSDVQFCEFTFLPSNLYTANVIRNTHGSTYETSFGTSNSKTNVHKLKISEILVGIKNNRFYLCSSVTGKIIYPTSTNMFNPQLKPQILRLIDDIATDGIRFYNKPWQNLFEKFDYIPMIKYKNFILEQEKWRIRLADLNVSKHGGLEKFKVAIQKFMKEKNLPSWVNLVEGDKKILLNLSIDRCLNVLKNELEKKEVVLEKYDIETEQAVKYKDLSYCCELVIPLVLCDDIKGRNDFRISTNYTSNRIKTPFDEWLYFKIYGVKTNIDYLLGEALYAPLQNLLDNKEIESYFFIQYKDPDYHLRLRIKADNRKLYEVQPKIIDILSHLIREEKISRYTIDCYEMELERYGGYELLDLAHQVFYKDSLLVQTIIYEKKCRSIKMSNDFLALLGIFSFIGSFDLDLEETFLFLNCDKRTKRYQKEFKDNRQKYISFVLDCMQAKGEDNEVTYVLNHFSALNIALKKYLKGITEVYPDDKIIKLNILDSLLHMHMNRLFGPNVDYERDMRSLARHAYYSIYCKNKKTGILDGEMNAKI